MRVYGVTGGIASGKSVAARRFATHGFPVVDADAVGHAVIAPGGSAERDVLAAFGAGILTDGRIDRRKLGARVFADAAELDRLNGLVQPRIKAEIARQMAELARQGHAAAVIDAALLGEGGKIAVDLAGIVLVLAPRELRAQRLVATRGLTREEAYRRMDAQTSPEDKLPLARWVIQNTGSIEELYARVDGVAAEMRADSGVA